MALNGQYIESTIDSFARTCFLTARIHTESGCYVAVGSYLQQRRVYLSERDLKKMLKKNGYCQRLMDELTAFIQESIQSAYERGVFVVSSRVIGLSRKQVSIDSPSALLSYFRDTEREYFDPMLWYKEGVFVDALLTKRFSHDIANELGAYTLRHVRTAFSVGMKIAAEKVIK